LTSFRRFQSHGTNRFGYLQETCDVVAVNQLICLWGRFL